jgi:hypothetical protein
MLDMVKDAAKGTDLWGWLNDRKNRKAIPHRLEKCGYISVRNDADKNDGQWKIGGKRCTLYGQLAVSAAERLNAARRFSGAASASAKAKNNGQASDEKDETPS